MQTRTLLAAVATAAITAIATPAISHAQDTTRKDTTTKRDTTTRRDTTKMQVSTGDVALQPSYSSLISAINSTSSQSQKLKDLSDVPAANVQLVNVDDLLKGNDVEALHSAINKHQSDITALRSTLGQNSTIANTLTTNAAALTPADVVATDVSPDGKVTVYYWKKSQ